MLENGFFMVTWHDHDERERVKAPSDVRKVSKVDVQGLRRVGLPAAPRDLGQDSEQRARRSLGAGNRCEADKGGGSRCIYRMYTKKNTHAQIHVFLSLSSKPICVYFCIWVIGTMMLLKYIYMWVQNINIYIWVIGMM